LELEKFTLICVKTCRNSIFFPLTSEYVFEWCTTEKFPKHLLGVSEREREPAENVKLVLVVVATVSTMVVVTIAITHQPIFAVLVVDAAFFLCKIFTKLRQLLPIYLLYTRKIHR
jgi:hypothetical protein